MYYLLLLVQLNEYTEDTHKIDNIKTQSQELQLTNYILF